MGSSNLQANVSLLTTKSFGANDTVKSFRSSSDRSVEWEERLKGLAEVIRAVDESKSAERVEEALEEGFKELGTILAQISTSKRPPCIFELVTTFAIALVKLQQWQYLNVCKTGDELLTELVHKTLGYWLNARTHFNDLDRAWAHTRSVLVALLRNITAAKTLVSVKHLISSMLTELLSYIAKEEDYAYGVYASEQLEYLGTIITQQLRQIENAV